MAEDWISHANAMKMILARKRVPSDAKDLPWCDGCTAEVKPSRQVYQVAGAMLCGICAIRAGEKIIQLVKLWESENASDRGELFSETAS